MMSNDSLAIALNSHERYRREGQIVDLHDAIDLYRGLLHGDGQANVIVHLSRALQDQFLVQGVQDDLNDAISLCKGDGNTGNRNMLEDAGTVSSLSSALRLRYTITGDKLDLDGALSLSRTAIALFPRNHPDYSLCLEDHARALCSNFEQSCTTEELDSAITIARNAIAVEGTPPHRRAGHLECLSLLLGWRFSTFGGISYIEEAISLAREALTLRPPSHSAAPLLQDTLAMNLLLHSRLQDDTHDLEEALTLFRSTLPLYPVYHPQRVHCLINMACGLSALWRQKGSIDYLNGAIDAHREAASRARTDPLRSVCFNNVGNCLNGRFEVQGSMDDLEEALLCHRQALVLRPPGHPYRSSTFNNLGNSLWYRWIELGDDTDFEESVECYRAALDLRDETHPQYVEALNNIGDCYGVRYRLEHHDTDFQEGSKIFGKAADLSCPPLYHIPALHGLGDILLARFQHVGDTDALEEARCLLEEALAITTSAEYMRPEVLRRLAEAYHARFKHTRHEGDALRARQLLLETTRLAGAGHNQYYTSLLVLADLHIQPGTTLFNVETALTHYMEAVVDSDARRSSQLRLQNAIQFLDALEDIGASYDSGTRNHLLQVYSTAIGLLPHVAYFGLDITSRLRALVRAESLATRAASHALLLSQPERAIEILEQGRSIFWQQALKLRTQFDDVPDHLRTELNELSTRLERRSYTLDCRLGREESEREAIQTRKETERLNELVDEVRKLPGFERFLLHDTISTFVDAAKDGPIVLLICTSISCHAITIQKSGKVVQVPLPSVDDAWLHHAARIWKESSWDSRNNTVPHVERLMLKKAKPNYEAKKLEERALDDLWERVVGPIIESLGLKVANGRVRPRLWWIPTGMFNFLPLHAAGRTINGIWTGCPSYAVSSYSPTIGAILHARRTYTAIRMVDAKILLGAVPSAHSEAVIALPQTIEEVISLRREINAGSILTLPENDAIPDDGPAGGLSVGTLLELLPQANILHLACHGLQDLKDPLKSRFILRDGTVTIEQLMPLPLPHAFFAFLSACETARGDKSQPDQLIHLASAMLFAGFKSVIGTIWNMNDCDGPAVAKIVYRELFASTQVYLDPASIAYALDEAVQELRDRGFPPSRWATYIHIGM